MGETPGRNERDRTKPDRLSACIRPADYEFSTPRFLAATQRRCRYTFSQVNAAIQPPKTRRRHLVEAAVCRRMCGQGVGGRQSRC